MEIQSKILGEGVVELEEQVLSNSILFSLNCSSSVVDGTGQETVATGPA